MRRIPRDQFLSGLSQPAQLAISQCEQRYAPWFKPEYHLREGVERLCRELRERAEDKQLRLAARDYTLRWASVFISEIQERVRDSHKSLAEADRRIVELQKPNYNPHLQFLSCIETRETANELIAKSDSQLEKTQANWEQLETVAGNPSSSESDIVECPLDRTKLRVPSGRKRLQVTCTTCKYKFVATTLKSAGTAQVAKRQKRGLLKSLKAAFGRR